MPVYRLSNRRGLLVIVFVLSLPWGTKENEKGETKPERMDASAPRLETPSPATSPLVTGRFHETPGYASWRPKGTRDYLLIFTQTGRGRFGSGDGTPDLFCERGDTVLLRPGALHDYGTAPGASGWEIVWAHFLPRPHWSDLLQWPAIAPGLLRLSLPDDALRDRVENALVAMNRHARGEGGPRRDQFALHALEEALLWCDMANPEDQNARRDARIARAVEILQSRLADPISVSELAREVDLSPSHLAHLFKAQTGQTPQQFVENERLARAQQLLSLTGRTVAAIAEEVGFPNPFYFSLRFKKRTGKSPREWRKTEQN